MLARTMPAVLAAADSSPLLTPPLARFAGRSSFADSSGSPRLREPCLDTESAAPAALLEAPAPSFYVLAATTPRADTGAPAPLFPPYLDDDDPCPRVLARSAASAASSVSSSSPPSSAVPSPASPSPPPPLAALMTSSSSRAISWPRAWNSAAARSASTPSSSSNYSARSRSTTPPKLVAPNRPVPLSSSSFPAPSLASILSLRSSAASSSSRSRPAWASFSA